MLGLAMSGRSEPRLRLPAVNSNGVALSLTGDTGSVFTVESSTNLRDWVPLFSGVLNNGATNLLDQRGGTREFYRAYTGPSQRLPVNVTAQTDPDSYGAAFLTPDGADLAIYQPDGTQLTLYVPTNSVVDPLLLTMTQVTNFLGLPFSGGLLAAVSVQPNELDLFGAALLKFPIPPNIDRRRLVSFTCGNDGRDLRLKLDRITNNEVAIIITAPGIYGTALATTQEVASLAQPVRPAVRPLWRDLDSAEICFPDQVRDAHIIADSIANKARSLESEQVAQLSAARQSQADGTFMEDPAPFYEHIQSQACDFYKKNIAPYWQQASNNCTLGTALFQITQQQQRSFQLLPAGLDCTAAYLTPDVLCAHFALCRTNLLQCCLEKSQGIDRVRDLRSMAEQMKIRGINGVPGCFDLSDPVAAQTLAACTNLLWNGIFAILETTNTHTHTVEANTTRDEDNSIFLSFYGGVINSTEVNGQGILKIAGPLEFRDYNRVRTVTDTGKCGISQSDDETEETLKTNVIYTFQFDLPTTQQYGIFAAFLGGDDLSGFVFTEAREKYWEREVFEDSKNSCSQTTYSDSNTNILIFAGPPISPMRIPAGSSDTNVLMGATDLLDLNDPGVPANFRWYFQRRPN
jgi:hypothetical protein